MFSEINKRKELKVEAEETGFKRKIKLVTTGPGPPKNNDKNI